MTVHIWALNEQLEKKNINIASFPWQVKWKRIALENMRYKPNILLPNTEPFLPGNFPALCHTHTQEIERDMKLVFVICRYYSLQATISFPV
jgi:hypothetical protein